MSDNSELPPIPARETACVDDLLGWKTRLRGVKDAVLPAHDGRPNPVVVGRSLYCVSFSPGAAWAFDARTGEVLWRTKLGSLAGPTPLVSGRLLFAKTSAELFCLDRRDGRIRWAFRPYQTAGESLYTSPVVCGALVVVADRRGWAHALAIRSGRVIWAADVGRGSSVNSTPCAAGTTLVFGTNGREAVAVSTVDGSVRWRTRIDAGCITSPRLDGTAVVLHTDRVVYWLDRRNGDVRARWAAPARIRSFGVARGRALVVVEDGDVGRLHIVNRGKSIRDLPHPGFAMVEGLRYDEREDVVFDTRIMALGLLESRTAERLVEIRGFNGPVGTPTTSGGTIFCVEGNTLCALKSKILRTARDRRRRRC